jgi:hypothetical protein
MLADETEEAVLTGREALEMAEAFGLETLIPAALINIGSARCNAGDEGGVADLERAIEIASRTNNPDLARAYNNLAAMQSDVRVAYELQLKGKEAADRLGHAPVGRFIEGQLMIAKYDLGHWDEFLRDAGEFIAACEAGSPHYAESYVRECRANVLVARDDAETAAAEAARALELARQSNEPQTVQPALGVQIRVDLARGRVAEARRAARELIALLAESKTSFGVMTLALHADELGVAHELPTVIARLPERAWTKAASAIVEGDFVRAADIAGEHSWIVDEAELRLRAAEALVGDGKRADADVQLAKALAFFRSVGATRFVREGEALLAATA